MTTEKEKSQKSRGDDAMKPITSKREFGKASIEYPASCKPQTLSGTPKPEKEKIDDKYMFIYKKGIKAGKASRDGIFTVGDIMAIEKRAKQKAISNFAEKIKTWVWRYQKCIGEGTYSNPVTLQYIDTKDLLKEIDKLVEEQSSGGKK